MNSGAFGQHPIPPIDRVLRYAIKLIGRAIGVLLLVLVAVIMFDIATRGAVLFSSVALQELEWHLHTTVLMLALGYAYLTDSHVRIGFVRDRLSPRVQAAIEAAGCLVFLAPFCAVAIYYGVDFATTSFAQGEGSGSPGGLPHRWIVKSMVPIGMGLLLLAGLAVFARAMLVVVRGPERAPAVFDVAPSSTVSGE